MKSNRVFSFAEFAKIASRHEEDFSDFGTVVTQGQGEGSTYTFKDNASEVLGVAHVDTVQQGAHSSLISIGKERVLLCPRLDDRLGVYIITRLLPKLGITCDWLLTTGEEVGCSSAELFLPEKEYKWAFSFDRMGADCVLYQYEHKALTRLMRKNGFRVGQGSFSDLSSLDIGCSGVNFGCGYYDAHGLHAYAKLSETFKMVDLFAAFYAKFKDTRLPFDPCSRSYTMSAWHHGRNSYTHCGRNGYYGGSGYVGYSGYPESWNQNDKYLAWYQTDENLTQEEKFEILADEAQRYQGGADNGR